MFAVFTPQNFHQIKVAADYFQFILLKLSQGKEEICLRTFPTPLFRSVLKTNVMCSGTRLRAAGYE